MQLLNKIIVDGVEIIHSVDGAGGLIDPVATEKKITPILAKSDIAKQIAEKKTQMSAYVQQRYQAGQALRRATTPEEKRKLDDEYRLRSAQIAELQDALKPLADQLKQYRRDLVKTDPVYFTPPAGSELIDDADAEAVKQKLNAAITAGKLLKADKKEIPDNRGKVFYKKTSGEWFRFTPLTLTDTVPSGAILDAELSADDLKEIAAQDDAKRIDALKPADKEKELAVKIDGLMGEALTMRGKLEIQGDKDALKKSQDWFNAEKAKIEQVYK